MPIVSIIVPVYNLDSYIDECLESIRIQNFKDFEVIVYNDGSTDGSEKKIQAFCDKDKRFTQYISSNKGVAATRNSALDLCRGDYILFVDGDDYITQDCLSKCFEAISSSDVVFFNYFKVRDGTITNSRIPCYIEPINDEVYRDKIIEAIDIEPNPWGKFYRRKLFDSTRYPNGLIFEDYAILAELLLEAKPIFLIESLYYYRVRSGSIMTTFKNNHIDDKVIALRLIEKFICLEKKKIKTGSHSLIPISII